MDNGVESIQQPNAIKLPSINGHKVNGNGIISNGVKSTNTNGHYINGHGVNGHSTNGHSVYKNGVNGNGVKGHHESAHLSAPSLEEGPEATIPIAVVGMSCRFAGDATSPEKLWQLCADARTGWCEIPSDRFNKAAFFHPLGEKSGAVCIAIRKVRVFEEANITFR